MKIMRNEMKIDISIIIPAYNVEKYIYRTVNSVMKQTLSSLEIIVVNDGSTDRTLDILRELKEIDERIILINKNNGGLSSARNIGIEYARGKYIYNLDGDDWIEENCLEECFKFAEKENLDIVTFGYYYDYDNGKKEKYLEKYKNYEILNSEEFLKDILLSKNISAIWNRLLKKDLYINHTIRHPIRDSTGEDIITLPKLIYNSKKIGNISKAYYHYIYNPKSMSREYKKSLMKSALRIRLNLKKFFRNKKDIEELIDIEVINIIANGYFQYLPKKIFNKIYMLDFLLYLRYIKQIERKIIKKVNNKYKKNLMILLKLFPYKSILLLEIIVIGSLIKVYKQRKTK